MNWGFVIPALVKCRLNRRSSRVGACNVVLNDVFLIGRQFIFAVVPFEKYWESLGEC